MEGIIDVGRGVAANSKPEICLTAHLSYILYASWHIDSNLPADLLGSSIGSNCMLSLN